MLQRILLHIDLAFAYLSQFLKTRLEYKADLILGLGTGLLFQIVTLIFLDVLFAHRALTVNFWTKDQVLFIYGFSIFPLNLFFAFFPNLYNVGSKYIIEGNFDRILLRPLNSLFQVLMEKVDIESLIGLVVGGAIIHYASIQLGVVWTPFRFVIFIVMVFCGMMIYGGVFTTVAAFSFWWPDRVGLMAPMFNMITFGKYPVTIYNRLLQGILMWIIPFAFVAFFPSTFFFNDKKYQIYVFLIPVVSLCSMAVGTFIWNQGVRHYESTGT
jgi:ABC-2 type transport system permease protein